MRLDAGVPVVLSRWGGEATAASPAGVVLPPAAFAPPAPWESARPAGTGDFRPLTANAPAPGAASVPLPTVGAAGLLVGGGLLCYAGKRWLKL